MDVVELTLADPDRYLPTDAWDPGRRYLPARPPAGWVHGEQGTWTAWSPPADRPGGHGGHGPEQGWKVHVSARFERADAVLDAVTECCAALDVPFKHVRGERDFLWLHHKHAHRSQSGKFCTLYPPGADGARAVMARLAAALDGEEGPYVLTDRRFGSSRVVSYRYGSFVPRFRPEPDGTLTAVLLDGRGAEVLDDRAPRFGLVDGIADPFQDVVPPVAPPGPVLVGGYRFTAVLQHSNAGGTYRAVAPDGREVVVVEAREHNGYQWDGTSAQERLRRHHELLVELHAAAPGTCPEPLGYFRHWEHEFLVVELVPGETLQTWVSRHDPLARTAPTAAACRAYHRRCRAVVTALRRGLDRLHELGYAFVDLNPGNVLVDDDDRPRLIDFEEARRFDRPRGAHGADGYLPPDAHRLAAEGGPAVARIDDYALGGIAQLLLHPLHGVLDRRPDAAAHLAAGLPHVPPDLWRLAASRSAGPVRPVPSPPAAGPRRRGVELPSPQEVAAEPARWLARLAEHVTRGVQHVPDGDAAPPHAPYPLGPHAHATNPHGLAYGTAGVVHALHRAGAQVHPRALRSLLDVRTGDPSDLPPGLLTGTAGIAAVLAELGEVEAAADLLARADRHPLLARDATLGHGTAGVALAHLLLHRCDRDPRRVERAHDLLAALPDGDPLAALLDADGPTGWLRGRAGIAQALLSVAARTGDARALHRARALLLADLDQAVDDGPGLQFRVSRADARIEPYLACGSAGFALVAGRYLDATGGDGRAPDPSDDDPPDDDPLGTAFRRCVATVATLRLPTLPTLFEGLAGIGAVLADRAEATGDPALADAATRCALSLFTYAVPWGDGVAFLGIGNRISADLAHGGAGVLLFLDQLLTSRRDALLTAELTAGGAPTARGPAAVAVP